MTKCGGRPITRTDRAGIINFTPSVKGPSGLDSRANLSGTQ